MDVSGLFCILDQAHRLCSQGGRPDRLLQVSWQLKDMYNLVNKQFVDCILFSLISVLDHSKTLVVTASSLYRERESTVIYVHHDAYRCRSRTKAKRTVWIFSGAAIERLRLLWRFSGGPH